MVNQKIPNLLKPIETEIIYFSIGHPRPFAVGRKEGVPVRVREAKAHFLPVARSG